MSGDPPEIFLRKSVDTACVSCRVSPLKETTMSKPNIYNVVLVCRNKDGAPTSIPYRVDCTPEQFDEIEYLESICNAAENNGNLIDSEFPIVVADGDPLWEAFTYVYHDDDWAKAEVITLP